MKPFALHLVVVFIVGAQIGTFCSSETPPVLSLPPSPSSSSPAHDRSSNANAATSISHSSSSTLLRHQQTTKTPRTIQRMVAGHLQHPPERRPHIESTTVGHSQVIRNSFRTRPPSTTGASHLRQNATILKKIEPSIDEDYDRDDDAALLEDPRDDDNWDNGILRSSAGAGKESNVKGKKKDDSKKTLSDQVKEGKYGLIEKELFQTEPKRPGIISYLGNKEIPGDNAQNLGGLNEDDIWLAEDHLLVLKGGSLNDDDKNEPWKPIDDYEAPNRQIKIPSNPKVPPPFPVQFEDNGPIQLIGNNKFPFLNPLSNQSVPVLPGDGYFPSEAIGDNEKNLLTGPGAFKNVTNSKGGYFYPPPFPPWLPNNETFVNPFLNFGTPLDGLNGSLDNSTDYIDEDDPSLYYPPPYSFVYKSNYSSPVPPGPLVPGIVLPPPPNAFARLEEPGSKKEHKEIPFRQVLSKIADYGTKPVVITTTPTTSTTTTTTTTQAAIKPIYSAPPKEVFYAITRPPKQERTRGHTTTTQIITNSPPPSSSIQPSIGRLIPKTHTPSRRPPQYINFIPNVSTQPPPPPPPPQTYLPKVTYSRQQVPDIINFIPNVPSSTPATPDVISFIPKAPIESDNLSKGNPIYYEYFDARKAPVDQLHYNQYTTSTQSTVQVPSRPHKKIEITTSQPFQQARLSKNYLPQRPVYNYDDYVYITPKPEIRPNSGYIPIVVKPSYKPAQNFEREVDAIRQKLEFYKDQQLQQNYIPRAPKAKAVYEYSFDARPSRDFVPPSQYDNEPFKPMVQYSRPIEDTNGFKAIAYAKSDEVPPQPQANYYSTTTPLIPQQRTRTGAKSYGQVINTTPRQEYTSKSQRNYVQRPIQNIQQFPTPRGPLNVQPWVSIEKQVVQEVEPQISGPSSHRQRGQSGYSRNEPQRFNGYYYNPPVNSNRQNDRYYQLDGSLSKHLSAIKVEVQQFHAQLRPAISLENNTYVNYAPNRPPINPISLENDTYVNYAPNRPPINSEAEFIRPPYPGQQQLQNNQALRLIPSREQQYHPISLDRDVLVNYRLPRPPINPDSEFVQPQVVVVNRNQPIYHRPPQYRVPAEPQSSTYYFAPRDVRYRKN